jgi:hypothetical protein
MPISSLHSVDDGLIRIECSGVIRDVDLGDLITASLEGLAAVVGGVILLDFTQVESVEVSPKAISKAAHENRGRDVTQGVKMAVVAPTDVAFGLARMYQLSRDDEDNVQVFRERADAWLWLGRSDPKGA